MLHVHVIPRHARHLVHFRRYLHAVEIARVLRDHVVQKADLARRATVRGHVVSSRPTLVDIDQCDVNLWRVSKMWIERLSFIWV